MISWGRVEELRHEVGEEVFDEVVKIFLEEVEGVIDRLRLSPDPNKLEADLHFLKGGALNLGFEYFSQLCEEGERNAAQNNAAAIDVHEVIAAYETSKSEFVSRIGPMPAGA